MVDFGELKDKAQGLVAEHADKIKEGITKAGGFVGDKIGDDKTDPVEGKLHDLVDKAAGKDDEVVPPPVKPNVVPPTVVHPTVVPPTTPTPPPAV
ncbi:MAG: Rv0909 family putative TA system antitoxin [Nakamurella sp.]